MSDAFSPGNPSVKRAKLLRLTTLIIQRLSMFWVTGLALVIVVLYGLYAGWSLRKQWSDALFIAAVAQMFIAAIPILGSSEEISAASEVRYIVKGDISETRDQLAHSEGRRVTFSLRVFIGSLLTILIAVFVTWV